MSQVLKICLIFGYCSLQTESSFIRRRPEHNLYQRRNLPYPGWNGNYQNPSGAIPGAYYSSGDNPHHGQHGSDNGIVGGIETINYGDGNTRYHVPQDPYPMNSIGYHAIWQKPSDKYKQSIKNPYRINNRYPPGSLGWYAMGNNNYRRNHTSGLSAERAVTFIAVLVFLNFSRDT